MHLVQGKNYFIAFYKKYCIWHEKEYQKISTSQKLNLIDDMIISFKYKDFHYYEYNYDILQMPSKGLLKATWLLFDKAILA